jgi:hypothetical protein
MIIANIVGIGNIKSATIREKRIIVMHKEMAYALGNGLIIGNDHAMIISNSVIHIPLFIANMNVM